MSATPSPSSFLIPASALSRPLSDVEREALYEIREQAEELQFNIGHLLNGLAAVGLVATTNFKFSLYSYDVDNSLQLIRDAAIDMLQRDSEIKNKLQAKLAP